jgi:acyl carrier protein
MQVQEPTLLDDVAELISQVTGVDRQQLQAETALDIRLGVDSLVLVELMIAAEERFEISIPVDIVRARTVGEATQVISALRDAA